MKHDSRFLIGKSLPPFHVVCLPLKNKNNGIILEKVTLESSYSNSDLLWLVLLILKPEVKCLLLANRARLVGQADTKWLFLLLCSWLGNLSFYNLSSVWGSSISNNISAVKAETSK